MKRLYKKYFIPHEGNDERPHLLRKPSVVLLSYLIFALFGGALILSSYIRHSNFTAVVLPDILVDLANGDRTQNAVNSLTINQTLVQVAQLKADDMAAGSYFAHVSPSGVTPWHWFAVAGYTYRYAGENLAVDFNESTDVNTAWMNSPGHRANILNTHFTEVGIATAQGTYQGHPTVFIVQEFGQPLPKPATAVPTAEASSPASGGSTSAPTPAPKPTPKPAPKPIAIATPPPQQVESTTSVQTIAEDQLFIAVKNTAAASDLETSTPPLQNPVPHYSNWWQRFIAAPTQALQFGYLIIALLVLIALSHLVLGGIETHHYKQVIKGMLLLILMAVLLYTFRVALFSEVIVR